MFFVGAILISTMYTTEAYIPFPEPAPQLPKYAPTYDMRNIPNQFTFLKHITHFYGRNSTILMGCNYTGAFDESLAAEWGLVDLDWSNNKPLWTTTRPMDAENEMLQTSRRIKAHYSKLTTPSHVCFQNTLIVSHWQAKSGGRTKMWVYRNLVWAPSWFKDVQEKLEDPDYAGFFVPYKASPPYQNPKCSDLGSGTVCSNHFHASFQTPLLHNSTAKQTVKDQAGVCDEQGCDCGTVPCAWYLFIQSSQP